MSLKISESLNTHKKIIFFIKKLLQVCRLRESPCINRTGRVIIPVIGVIGVIGNYTNNEQLKLL